MPLSNLYINLLRCFCCCYDYFNIFFFLFLFLFYSPEFGGGRWRLGDDVIMTSLPKHCVDLLLYYQINFINYTMCELVNISSIGKSVACIMAVRTLQTSEFRTGVLLRGCSLENVIRIRFLLDGANRKFTK